MGGSTAGVRRHRSDSFNSRWTQVKKKAEKTKETETIEDTGDETRGQNGEEKMTN